jgi:hypothetical protein
MWRVDEGKVTVLTRGDLLVASGTSGLNEASPGAGGWCGVNATLTREKSAEA